jgi:hypothetical protein
MMTDSKAGRPTVLSILCVLGLFGCFLKTIMVISPSVQNYGRWYAVYVSLSAVVMIACLCGLWLMKKWAFWSFLVYFIVNMWIYFEMGILNLKAISLDPQVSVSFALVPVTLLVTLIYYRRLK